MESKMHIIQYDAYLYENMSKANLTINNLSEDLGHDRSE